MLAIKRTVSIVLVFLLVISISLPVSAASNAPTANLGDSGSGATIEPFGLIDTTPPVLQDITVDKTTVTVPDTLTITANATDNMSGVSHISVWFWEENDLDLFQVSLYNDHWDPDAQTFVSTPYFTGTIDLETQLPLGVYLCTRISVHDNAGNTQVYTDNPYGDDIGALPLPTVPSITVINNLPQPPTLPIDTTPPVLTGLSLDKATVRAGEEITLTASATDDLSGVGEVFVSFSNEDGDCISFDIFHWADNTWADTNEISRYQPPGEYNCNEVNVYDRAGNPQNYGADLEQWQIDSGWLPLAYDLSFTITGTTIDKTPPKIVSISLSKSEINTPDTLTVTATASDDISGVRYISVDFFSEVTGDSYYSYLENENGTGIFTGTIETGIYDLPGVYDCTSITVSDYADNYQEYVLDPSDWQLQEGYLPLPFSLSFTVINDGTGAYVPPTDYTKSSSVTSRSSGYKGASKTDTTPEINLGRLKGVSESSSSEKVKALFNKFFANELVVVHAKEAGTVSVQLDLSKLNKDNLVFYSYDPTESKYRLIEKPSYTVTKNGYLEFNTAVEGYIIVTDRLLQKK